MRLAVVYNPMEYDIKGSYRFLSVREADKAGRCVTITLPPRQQHVRRYFRRAESRKYTLAAVAVLRAVDNTNYNCNNAAITAAPCVPPPASRHTPAPQLVTAASNPEPKS